MKAISEGYEPVKRCTHFDEFTELAVPDTHVLDGV